VKKTLKKHRKKHEKHRKTREIEHAEWCRLLVNSQGGSAENLICFITEFHYFSPDFSAFCHKLKLLKVSSFRFYSASQRRSSSLTSTCYWYEFSHPSLSVVDAASFFQTSSFSLVTRIFDPLQGYGTAYATRRAQ
jgi:hypothetical protein